MTSPFVAKALEIWDQIAVHHAAIWSLHNESICYRATPSHGARHADQGCVHAENRLLAAGGAAAATHVAGVKAALEDLQAHLLPYPILGAGVLRLNLYHDSATLSVGPWAGYAFHFVTPADNRAFIEKLATVAEADGTTVGQKTRINWGRGRGMVNVNTPALVRDLFTYCQEDVHLYQHTTNTATHTGFDLPTNGPLALPNAIWTDLWAALDAVRAVGIRSGYIAFFNTARGTAADATATGLTPAWEKKLGHPSAQSFVLPPTMAAKLADVERAVLALHAAVRAAAPILTALDAWGIDHLPQNARHAQPCEMFTWGPKSQSLLLMGGGPMWGGPHPVAPCNAVRFRYILERALGMIAALPMPPARGWISKDNGCMLPGATAQDAALLGAALASGNKPGFVPGAHVRAGDMPKTPWEEVIPFP